VYERGGAADRLAGADRGSDSDSGGPVCLAVPGSHSLCLGSTHADRHGGGYANDRAKPDRVHFRTHRRADAHADNRSAAGL
jgi:hypothetical protein